MHRHLYAGTLLAIAAACSWFLGPLPTASANDTAWLAGLSRIDVTPHEPVRMAGYGSRNHASEGIDTPLHARCLAIRNAKGGPLGLLISVDTIGLPGSMTRELAKAIQQKHEVSREQIVFCSTHTHCGPDLVSELSNIFATPLTENETAAGQRYRSQLSEGILQSVDGAIADLAPATLAYESGQVGFAANRRVLKEGRWAGFGVQADAPVDHSVPVLRINDGNGKLRGAVFNYACHCTTLGGDHYHINGDWAGYAASNLEAKYPGAIALSTIGCGADANPDPRGSLDAAKIHGRSLSAEVSRVLDGPMSAVDAELRPRFDYAALSFDLPTREELQQRVQDTNPQSRRHAEQLLSNLDQHGRLPATYPVPIQSWQFGDQLTMVFLGGEVVVDYALRLKQQLAKSDLWVTAYANDVMGYVASERMIAEGGYEYDRSGVYYGLPGPWASGTEDLLVSRVLEMLASRGRSKPVPADQACDTMELTDGFSLELVAAEPLVEDPINIAFDAQGRLWVVEMGGYPEKESGGRVKTLTDTDGDGHFDHGVEFLNDLSYPTGVMPWKEGVLVSAAPDVLLARDTDGDGKADTTETLYTGFALANPQHRISGFTYGLDHSLHLASGDNLGTITSLVTDEKVNASGHDVQIWPDRGSIAVTSGRTQYVRSRNDWGEWFGNDNSHPMFHFPIEDAYLKRNPAVAYSGSSQQLFDPPVAPPVFPLTSASERFNDLFAANRFTSACSSIVARTPAFAGDANSDVDTAFICEPVHNLVHRAALQIAGASYRAERCMQEANREFLRSNDPWFRPVRALVGPDGHLYIVDMYRETIEHPEWIPESWQAQLDLYAGSDRGRIYRVRANGFEPEDLALARMTTNELVEQLRSAIGPRRDLVQQLILERSDDSIVPRLVALAGPDEPPHARVHAMSILNVMNRLDPAVLQAALESDHVGLLLVAIAQSESRLASHPELLDGLSKTAEHDDARVVLRTALALGQVSDRRAGEILATIAVGGQHDPWLNRAIASSARPHAQIVLDRLLPSVIEAGNKVPSDLIANLLITLRKEGVDLAKRYEPIFAKEASDFLTQLQLASSFTKAMRTDDPEAIAKMFQPLYAKAVQQVQSADSDEQTRCEGLRLIGIGIEPTEQDAAMLLDLLSPNSPVSVQQAAIDRLAEFADSDAIESLLQKWAAMSKSVRDHCVARMLERRVWTERLLDALESETIRVSDLSPAVRQQLSQTGTRSMRVRADRLNRLVGSVEKRTLIRAYLAEMDGPTDMAQGAAAFKQHCAVCHLANSQGEAIGASLNNLSDRSPETLLTAILDPNRAVDPKYLSYMIRTDDDRILVGAIEDEAGQSITLAHADGKRTTVLREEIAEMKNSGVSLMPEGLQSVLTPEIMRDLVSYLQTMPDINP